MEQERELQERVRLALWRMDSVAGAMVTAENARPASHFRDFHSADQAYTNSFQILKKGAVLIPSPLLNGAPVHTQLHCMLGPDGVLTSPQVPFGNNRDLAEQNYISSQEIETSNTLLIKAQDIFPNITPPKSDPAAALEEIERQSNQYSQAAQAEDQSQYRQEFLKNQGEFIKRNQTKSQVWSNNPQQRAQIRPINEMARQQAELAGVDVKGEDRTEPFEGVWKEGELFLVRNATTDGLAVIQGVWLNADSIRKTLLDEVHDLLPNASLVPVTDTSKNGAITPEVVSSRLQNLVSLPLRLDPGEIPMVAASAFWSPLRRSLAIAWGCVLLAAVAAAALGWGVVRLSERRAAFVSAVTHEMRTPLTTFRLYSEMLSDDMVKDENKRREYLGTLTSEADRLSHLVENVLSYAQLERGSARAQIEETSLQAIIDRVLPRLSQRASQDDMRIEIDADPEASSTRVKVDLTAVEQILFNLVDNACKYAKPESDEETDRVIHLEADTDGPMALLRVRDHGRGISKAEENRLFRPFEKSACEAAHTAPGVGLGAGVVPQADTRARR